MKRVAAELDHVESEQFGRIVAPELRGHGCPIGGLTAVRCQHALFWSHSEPFFEDREGRPSCQSRNSSSMTS